MGRDAKSKRSRPLAQQQWKSCDFRIGCWRALVPMSRWKAQESFGNQFGISWKATSSYSWSTPNTLNVFQDARLMYKMPIGWQISCNMGFSKPVSFRRSNNAIAVI